MLCWAQHQSEETSPNLVIFTEHFNKVSYWVRTRVIDQPDQKEREKYFWKFIKIMRVSFWNCCFYCFYDFRLEGLSVRGNCYLVTIIH